MLLCCHFADSQVPVSILLLSVLVHRTCIITVIVTCAAVVLICTVTVAVTRIVTAGFTFIVDKKIVYTVTIWQCVNFRTCRTFCAAIMTTLTRVRKILLFIPT